MPKVETEFLRLKALMEKGLGEERCTPAVLARHTARERVANKDGKTRFIWNVDSPAFYSRLNAQKDRYVQVIENKTVAIEVFLDVLESPTDERLRELAKGERN